MRLTTHAESIAAAHRVAEAWAPGVIDRDRAGASVVPHDALSALDTSGLLEITVPTEFGGPGLGPPTLAEVVRILAAVDPALAQVPQGHYLLVDVLAVWGSDTARERLFGEVRAGRRFGNALAERGGKHAQDLKTRLTGSQLTGKKYYCTGALTARPSTEAVRYGAGEVAGDPHVLHRYGRLAAQVRAAEALLAAAAAELDRIGLVPADAEAAARGSLAVAAAKAFGSEVAVDAGSQLFALAGTSATDERWDLHRHWRNARTHSVHDPVDWKYHHLGAYEIAGVLPPNHGQL